MLWVVTPMLIAHGGDPTRVMTFIFFTFLIQYLPKVVHSALMVRRLQRVTGYIFGTASSGFFLNLITYFIAAHVSLNNSSAIADSPHLKPLWASDVSSYYIFAIRSTCFSTM